MNIKKIFKFLLSLSIATMVFIFASDLYKDSAYFPIFIGIPSGLMIGAIVYFLLSKQNLD